mmetsp:Transcript_70932/g.208155  ORF Transcript_70932/g.208155 Transcript_70932/m.208155 type:complete len:199 (+) Transcript_70932:82-678(+)
MSQEPRKTAAGALLGAMAVVCAPAAFVQSGAVQSLTGMTAPRRSVLLAASMALLAGPAAAEIDSVMGAPLSTCSKPGMAMTGFTRDGHCQDLGDDDAGSHHICIQMRPDFCTVTGQPNWCGKQMPCMGQAGNCPIGNWCVCQWAFARYIQMAGGCDAIVDLQCDATNMAAMRAYEKEENADKSIKDAITCLRQKCGLQ